LDALLKSAVVCMGYARYIISIALQVCLILSVSAQETPLHYPAGPSSSDSAQIMDLIKKAGDLQTDDPDSSVLLAKTAYSKCLQTGYTEGAGRALALIGVGLRNQGQFRESIVYFKKALPLIQRQRQYSDYFLAAAYNVMFGAYFAMGNYDSAAMNCYRVIALYNQKSAGQINPQYAVVNPLIDAYQYLGLSWYKLGFYHKALQYMERAEQLSAADSHRYEMLPVVFNKSNIYLAMNMPDSASRFMSQAWKLATDAGDAKLLRSIRLNRAMVQLQKDRPEEAAAQLEQLLAEDTTAVMSEFRINTSYWLAEAYLRLGRYGEALRLIEPAEKKARSMDLNYNIIQPHLLRASIYEKQGQMGLAYRQLKIVNQLSDSLMGSDKIQALNILDLALETVEKDKQLMANHARISDQENKLKKKNTWLAAITACVLFLVVLLAALYRSHKHKRRLQEEQISSLNKEHEIAQLKAMMKGEEHERTRLARELHDGFISQLSAIKMNFSALSGHPGGGKFEENMQRLQETIQELRLTAHNLMPEILLNGSLAEAVQLYCERMSAAHQLHIDFQVYGFLPRLRTEFELTLYRIIQEALQNIVKHSGADIALVQINHFDGVVSITVEDNGNGFSQQDIRHKRSAGIDNLNARVNALNGYINISDKSGVGTTVYIEFEINDKIRATA